MTEQNRNRGGAGWRPGRRGAGFALVDAVIALAVAAVLVAGIYTAMVTSLNWWSAGEQAVEVQQTIRGALDRMVDEIRETGALVASTEVSGKPVALSETNLLLLDEDGVVVWYYLHSSGALRRVKNGAYNTLAYGVGGLTFRYLLGEGGGEAPDDPEERARSSLVVIWIEGLGSRGEGFALEGRATIRVRLAQ